jgi:ribosome recycling factor
VTDSGSHEPDPGPGSPLQAATEDLDDLRRLLIQASQGAAEPAQVGAAVRAYWRDHSDTLRATAAAVTEQVRTQTLEELYKWRDQLARQLDAQRTDKE